MCEGYKSRLSLRDTERAIKLLKDAFERKLSSALKLERISAPMFVRAKSGVNDDLNGIDRPVTFDIKECGGLNVEVVQSLAKWKRIALKKYGFNAGEGLYTDMNAIRRDDTIDNIHSVYVDQWDWEKVIVRENRTIDFLKDIVRKIAGAIVDTQNEVKAAFPALDVDLKREVYFISSQELYDMFPHLSSKEREREIAKREKTVFITQIGGVLSHGEAHDGRAPDYDDWSLNGDLLFYEKELDSSLEISSMGIRVDDKSLKVQLEKSGHTDRLKYDYHKDIMSGALPLTIGGGIGQSRLCMLILQKKHIGEVQVSIWPEKELEACQKAGIKLL